MTPEEITEAIVLRFTLVGDHCTLTIHNTEILEIVRTAIRDERERIAAKWDDLPLYDYTPKEIAAAIRKGE